MNQFNKRIMVASIILAFGISGNVLANPTITERDVNPAGSSGRGGTTTVDTDVTKTAIDRSDRSVDNTNNSDNSARTSVDNTDNSVNTANSNNDNS